MLVRCVGQQLMERQDVPGDLRVVGDMEGWSREDEEQVERQEGTGI